VLYISLSFHTFLTLTQSPDLATLWCDDATVLILVGTGTPFMGGPAANTGLIHTKLEAGV
jgi:hypothetical protein